MAKFCVACGRPVSPDDSRCGHCGKILKEIVPPILEGKPISSENRFGVEAPKGTAAAIRQPFQWGWAFKSAGLTCVFIFALAYSTGVTCGLLFQEPDRLEEALVAFSCLSAALSYFLGGGLAAYYSPGRTIFEPAVGVALAVVLLNLVSANFGALYLGWIIPFGLGILGAKAGEYFQENRPKRVTDPEKDH